MHDLGDADVDDIFSLMGHASPGPFERRTITFAGYRGIRHDGTLVAMAGTSMRFYGWTEVSALATHPPYRGGGLDERLLRDVAKRLKPPDRNGKIR